MGTRVNRNDPSVATPVPSTMCAAALEAVCHKMFRKPGMRPAIDIEGTAPLKAELVRLYNIGAGDGEDKLTAKKVREIMSEKRDADGTLFFSEAKRDTNGVLPTETQIKTFYARLTKNKRAVAAPM